MLVVVVILVGVGFFVGAQGAGEAGEGASGRALGGSQALSPRWIPGAGVLVEAGVAEQCAAGAVAQRGDAPAGEGACGFDAAHGAGQERLGAFGGLDDLGIDHEERRVVARAIDGFGRASDVFDPVALIVVVGHGFGPRAAGDSSGCGQGGRAKRSPAAGSCGADVPRRRAGASFPLWDRGNHRRAERQRAA
ncbi:MAG: hypothetical protein EA398_01300 [Deltaproteobacteria bacterium]|nr:MAG: hypothetical protein EA398_01300 [Deltaproteobacteria bacterium]